ncbi:MAG: hypothetical protein ISN29_10185, partial [Gammaproteobacteria bacterium AqS3]|nr:hypothetical protein [Gammaproteobacteria bacterium AqS3]
PLTVTVLDDEIKLDITPLELTVNEGGSDSFDVRLKKAPSSAITVNVSLPSGSDVTVDKTALTFNASNWNVSQTVTVSAGPDDDSENDNVTIALSGTGVGSASVKVTVLDDDTAGLSLSGVLRKLDGDGAGRPAVALAAHSGNKPTDGLQILSHSDAMPDTDRVAGGSLGSLAFNMVKVSFADACPAGALPFKAAAAEECSRAVLTAKRFSPGAGKAGMSP